ncbi:SLOG family protein [Streptomyces omiyaensis]|uniref:SLOG family protein n=1 Tax=Streptomyces omiyaensis TaxID=68247 RepID=UPI003700B830
MPDPFRLLVTGSGDWTDIITVREALDDYLLWAWQQHRRALTAVHGHCPDGVDALADAWTRANGFTVEPHPARGHPAQDFGPWPGAGPRRNAFMVGLGADAYIAFLMPCSSPKCRRTDPHPSHGAAGTALLAENAGIPTWRLAARTPRTSSPVRSTSTRSISLRLAKPSSTSAPTLGTSAGSSASKAHEVRKPTTGTSPAASATCGPHPTPSSRKGRRTSTATARTGSA